MNNKPQVPKLVSDMPPLEVKKRVALTVSCPNPKCGKELDITNLNYGTYIECPKCKNTTWTPEFKERWWFKSRNFILSLIISFLIGLLSSLSASYVYDLLERQHSQVQK